MAAKFGRTPLHIALRAGEVDDDALGAMAEHLDKPDNHGFTPLYTAAMFDRVESIARLVRMGADLLAADLGGLTPLHIACEKGCAGAVAALVALGADRAALDSIGRSPRDWAVAKERGGVLGVLDASESPDAAPHSG